MDTLKDRLKILLEEKNMTQAAFADYINVGRPNITHLMTGRDKFSQKIVSRILLYFPEINPRWLLHGEGEMYKPLPNKNQEHDDTELHTYPTVERQATLFSTEEALPMEMVSQPLVQETQPSDRNMPVQESLPPLPQNTIETPKNEVIQESKPEPVSPAGCEKPQAKEKRIRKIVFFYDDKSFEEYYPEKE